MLILLCAQFTYANQSQNDKISSLKIRDRLITMLDKKVELGRFSRTIQFSRKRLTLQDIKQVYTHTLKLTADRYSKVILKNVFEKMKTIARSGKEIDSFNHYIRYFYPTLSSKQAHELFFASIRGGRKLYVTTFIKVGVNVNIATEKYGALPLEEALINKKLEVAKLLYAHGARSLFRNHDLNNAFTRAIRRNQLALVNFMIKIGIDVNHSARNGATPLVLATTLGNITLIKRLIKRGATLEKWSALPGAPIMVNATRTAVIYRNKEVLKLLLSLGAKLDQMPPKKYPKHLAPTELMIAFYTKNSTLVKYLLTHGASVQLASDTYKRKNIFKFLSNNKKIELLNALLATCVDINNWKKKHGTKPYKCKTSNNTRGLLSIFHYAVKYKQQVIIDRLIDHGILNVSPRARKILLRIAVRGNDTKLIKRLVKNGFKLPVKAKYKLLQHAVRKGNIDQVKRILSSGISSKYPNTEELLFSAISRNHIEIAKLLYKTGFREEGYNALHMATIFSDINEIKKQIGLGININSKTKENQTAIVLAVDKNLTLSAAALLKYKPEVNTKMFGGTLLSYAIKHKNIKLVKLLLNAGAKPNISWNQRMPLSLAIAQNNEEVFDLLLKHGAKPDMKNNGGITPLMSSVAMGRTKFTIRLLSIKQNIDTLDKQGQSILHYAAKSDDTHLVKLVIAKNPSINIQDKKGQTPLHHSVNKKSFTSTRLLLTLKPNLEIKNKAGETVLALAISDSRKAKLIPLLIKHGANVNQVKSIYIADLLKDKWSNNIAVAKLVLHKLSNVTILNRERNSLVTLASLRKSNEAVELLKILVKKGADINYKPSGKYNIGFRFTSKEKITLPFVQFLVKHGLDLKSKGDRGQSLLAEAIDKDNKPLIDFYLKKGLSIENKDNKGRTPLLYIVSRNGHKPKGTLEYLLSKGANINVKGQQGTPLLSLAIDDDNMEHVIKLIHAGASVNQGDNNRKTPLMYAASQYIRGKMISYLIAKGANVKAKDNNNKSVLDYCKYNECKALIKTALKSP